MSRKIVLFLVSVVFFSCAKTEAALIINEIMYDPAGSDGTREWIEIYNDGSGALDLANYKFFEANTNHGLALIQGSQSLSAGGYAVIVNDSAAFLTDWPSFTGTIFDSSFSLNNTGEALAIKDDSGNITNQYTYDAALGASDDGNTLQLISGSWSPNTPSPGEVNQSSGGSGSGGGGNSSVIYGGGTGSPGTPTGFVPRSDNSSIKLKITAPKTVFTDTAFELRGEATKSTGKYFWNFGDGTTETAREPVTFTHTYLYEGEYLVTLEFYSRAFANKPDATAQVTIKAVPTEVSISRVGDDKDFFIEISNDASYEMDLSQWKLVSKTKEFIFPRNSILLSKKKIILSGQTTGFDTTDKNTLELVNKEGETVYNYNYGGVPQTLPLVTRSSVKTPPSLPKETAELTLPDLSQPGLILEAITEDQTSKKSHFYTIIFGAFLGVSGGAVYFIRRKKAVIPDSREFTLLD